MADYNHTVTVNLTGPFGTLPIAMCNNSQNCSIYPKSVIDAGTLEPNEAVIGTGPYKLTGYPRDTAMREIELAKQGFLEAVQLGRGSRLKVGEETLLRAQVWTGIEAVRMGIIDELGSTSLAYEKAASMAKIARYETRNLREAAGLPEIATNFFFYRTEDGIITPYPNKAGVYMLYIPPVEKQP